MSFFTYHITYSSFGDIDAKSNIVLKPSDVDTSTTLKLPGQGKTNYGEFYNQNLLYLMEHFAKDTPPENPTTGQIWYQPYLSTIIEDPTLIPSPFFEQSNPTNIFDTMSGFDHLGNIINHPCGFTVVQANTEQLYMWDCTVQAWVTQQFVHRLRYYTDQPNENEDPDYPGWVIILIKLIKPPTDPKCGDIFYNVTTYTDINQNILTYTSDGQIDEGIYSHEFMANTMYVWDCTYPDSPGWNVLGNHNFVRLDGSNTPMTGVLRLIPSSEIESSLVGDTAVSKDWAVRKAGDTMTGSLVIRSSDTTQLYPQVGGLYDKTLPYIDLNINSNNPSIEMGQLGGTAVSSIFKFHSSDNADELFFDSAIVASGGTSGVDHEGILTLYGYAEYDGRVINNDRDWHPNLLAPKWYVDTDYQRYIGTTSPSDPHPPTVNGRIYWDTLYRRTDGTLEVNNLYWRNFTDDIKDRLKCSLDGVFSFMNGPIPSDINTMFKPWVQDRDKQLYLYYGSVPQTVSITIDLIQAMNYSSTVGPGGMLGVTQQVNLNNSLMLYLRQVMGNPNFTIHDVDFGTSGIPGKYSIQNEFLNQPTVSARTRSELPQINRITGYSTYLSRSSTTYPGTSVLMNAWDMWWMCYYFSPTYTVPAGFNENDGRLSIDTVLTYKDRDDANQRWVWYIYINDSLSTGTLQTYCIRYYRKYYITTDAEPVTGETFISGGTPPVIARCMARLHAVWQYNSTDCRQIIKRCFEFYSNDDFNRIYIPDPIGNGAYIRSRPSPIPANTLYHTLGLYYLTSGTGQNASQYINYLTFAGYTAGITFGVTTSNYDKTTGNVDVVINVTSGTLGYSPFPATLLLKSVTMPVTFRFYPSVGWNSTTGQFESIIDPEKAFTDDCGWDGN